MKYEGEKYAGIIIIMPKVEAMSKFYNLFKIKFCGLIYTVFQRQKISIYQIVWSSHLENR